MCGSAEHDDLYYRLSTFPIGIPALRERPEDIPSPARHFSNRFADKYGCPNYQLTAEHEAIVFGKNFLYITRRVHNELSRHIIKVLTYTE